MASATPAGTRLEDVLSSYRMMVLIRRFEERVHQLFLQGLIKSTTHLAAGQEAVAVGVSDALRADDLVFATYRGHHHVLARGAAVRAAMAEMLGRSTGLCGGKGGSMHLTSVEHGVLGCYAIVGAHLPIACGSAWSAQLRGTDQVTVAFFGDGATNIGAFHEALNLAAVWRLPLVFVCENNLYMEYTPIADMTTVDHPAYDRASAYRLPAELIDGNDLLAVHAAADKAVARARSGGGPTIIEALTYRHGGHSRGDPGAYRPKEEVEAWLRRDPLDKTWRGIEELDRGLDRQAIDADVLEHVDKCVEKALADPYPDFGTVLVDTYADGGSTWRT